MPYRFKEQKYFWCGENYVPKHVCDERKKYAQAVLIILKACMPGMKQIWGYDQRPKCIISTMSLWPKL